MAESDHQNELKITFAWLPFLSMIDDSNVWAMFEQKCLNFKIWTCQYKIQILNSIFVRRSQKRSPDHFVSVNLEVKNILRKNLTLTFILT